MDKEGARYGQPQYLPFENIPFYLYLALHKDRIVPQMVDNYGYLTVQVSFLNELASKGVPIGDQLMGSLINGCRDQELLSPQLRIAYFDSLDLPNRVETLKTFPDELLAALPAASRALSIAFLRQLSNRILVNLVTEDRNGLAKFINNGQPTVDFMDQALNNGYFQEIRQFLTPDLMFSFTPEKRQFFQACLDLPSQIVELMRGRASEWKIYFNDGKPTPSFLIRVAISGSGYESAIDQLLAITDFSSFSAPDQDYWKFYKTIPQNPFMRSFLLKVPDKFSTLVVNGEPTLAFLEMVAQDGDVNAIREVLPYIKTAQLPPEQRAFWGFYPKLDQNSTAAIRNYLLQHRSQFTEFIEEDRPTLAFLNQAASFVKGSVNVSLIQEILNQIDWNKMPAEENVFWQYYSVNQDSPFSSFILRNKAQFPQIRVNGNEAPLFYQLLASQEPDLMIRIAKNKPGLSGRQYQDIWRFALGKDVMDDFLKALPKATDEARNAFTGNDYDRTTEFIQYLKDRLPSDQFGLTALEFSTMTQYVRQFGLSRNQTIYKYYRNLYLFEHQQIANLPEEMKNLGITSIDEMIHRISEVRKMVFGERQLTDSAELSNLTPFQIQMLANVTRYDSARFGGSVNASNLSQKINQFANDLNQGLITPLPDGYDAETIEASSVKIEFNADAIKRDYEVLKAEILECIDHPPTVDQLKVTVRKVIERRIEKINNTLDRVKAEKAVAAMARDLEASRTYLSQLDQVQDVDSLILSLLGMNFSNEDRSGGADFTGIDSVTRRVILSKLYQRISRSPGFIENTRIKLSKDEITAEGIDEIILTVDEMVKNHVLSLDFGNKEGYWRPEIFKAILESESLRKNFRRITERFNPHAEKLRQEQSRFVKKQTGTVSNVRIIPDRGLIGEMAGYLADVCYTRVADLLRSYSGKAPNNPLVIPYKFVTEDPGSSEPRFLGSVLVFETQTAKGEPSLLVRALDIPNESEIDISKFTENLLDKFAGVAARRGRLKVQVAGTPGTISNYSATTSHVINEYVKGKVPCNYPTNLKNL